MHGEAFHEQRHVKEIWFMSKALFLDMSVGTQERVLEMFFQMFPVANLLLEDKKRKFL